MGLLNLFRKPASSTLVRLPSGSFTLDRDGQLMTSTLPQSFPRQTMLEIGRLVLASFREARRAQMPLARELRGGAIIFLMPNR